MIGGDRSALHDLVRSFIEEGAEIVQTMQRTLETRDRESLYRAAHSLKSGAQDMGALRLTERCRLLENEARDSWPNEAIVAVDAIHIAFDDARGELEKWLGRGHS